ncbi:unnamed protein product [Prunus brigantina]
MAPLSPFYNQPALVLEGRRRPTARHAALGRKRGRETSSTEVAAVEAVPVESTVVETAPLARPRKRVLLDLSEDEDEDEALPVTVSTPLLFFFPGQPGAEEAAAAEAMIEEEAITDVVETLDAEATATEVPAAEEAAADISGDEVPAMELTQAAQVEVPSVASAEPTSVVTVPTEPPPSAPPRPRGIVFRSPPRSSLPFSTVAVSLPPASLSQDSTVVTGLAVVETAATDALSPPPVSSTALTELVVVDVLGAPSTAEVRFPPFSF